MQYNKLFLAVTVAAIMTGCGSDSSDKKNSSSASFASCDESKTPVQCTLSGTVNKNYTLTADKLWLLNGPIKVGYGNGNINTAAERQQLKDAGVTLTIEPGTDVRGLGSGSALIVTRGSKLMAEGTAAKPITFSSIDENYDGMSEWGGVVIQGFAPQYGKGDSGVCYAGNADGICNVEGEGGSIVGKFGGNDVADNSGVIKYVRIAEGGISVGASNEINGLTLQGVGYGTTIEYVQVHGNLDDGVEWFGGTVNAKYLVLTNNDDDDLDFDEGYKGNIQHVIIKKSANAAPQGSNDPRGIEGNSDYDALEDESVSATHAAIANVTIKGNNVNNSATHSKGKQPGMKLRGKVNVELYNIAVTGFDAGCLEVKDAQMTDVNVSGVICYDTAYKNDNPASGDIVVTASAMAFDSAFAVTNDEAVDEAVTAMTAVDNGSGFTFDATDYAGAVDPDSSNTSRDWWSGWTIPGSVN